MYTLKTKEADQDIIEFIESSVPSNSRRINAYFNSSFSII